MAQDKNNKYIKEDKSKNNKTKAYKNPVMGKVGKTIIVILALAMALSGVISLIIMACIGAL